MKQAVKFFSDKLAGSNDLNRAIVLRGLESTEDKHLLPLFAALLESGDKELRLMGTAMIASVGGKDAAPALLKRLQKDPSMAIRGEALVQLDALDAISTADLEKAAGIDDEGIKIVAARMLASKGKTKIARGILTKLTESREPANVAFARMTLLGMGDRRQYAKLLRISRDPKTSKDVLIRLLNQIAQDKISSALPMVESMCSDDYAWDVRLRAYDVISKLSPKGTQKLTQAFNATTNLLLRINLLQMLADRDDSRDQIDHIAAGNVKNLVTIVAKFEKARNTKPFNPKTAEKIALEMVNTGHPVYIEYLLTRMAEDIEKDKSAAAFYATPIITYLSSIKLNPRKMTAEHGRAGKAVELLVDLGNETAMKGLWDIVSAPGNSPLKRMTVASMYRSDNDKVCDFVKPLLNSGYPKLRTYAALLLGKHHKPEAISVLEEIQNSLAKKKDPGPKSLINWYIISLYDNPTAAVAEISKTIK